MKPFLITILTALFIYTIPSNGAYVVGLIVVCLVYGEYRSALWLSIGIALAGLLYMPVLSSMLADPQTQDHASRMRILTEGIPEAIVAFISYRWLLLPLVALSLLRRRTRLFWWVLIITVVSLLLFVIQGSYLWARVLFPLLPLWCLAVGEMIGK